MLGYVFGDTEDLPREMKTKWKFRERPAGAIQGQRDRGASWRLLAAPGPSAGGLVPQVKVLATRLDDTLDARTPPGGKRRLTPSRCPLTSTSTTVCAPTQINEKLKKKSLFSFPFMPSCSLFLGFHVTPLKTCYKVLFLC